MGNYIITSDGNFVTEDELCHYGVLGMKWGVRRNASRAYERASKKMRKLNIKSETAKIKYGKKSGRHLTDFGVAAEDKARKRSARAEAKALKWKRAMDKTFSDKKLSSLEARYINKGEAYLKKIETSKYPKLQSIYSDMSSKNYAKSNDISDLRKRLSNG